jgi:hypothetical protein|nr:MAG TPA: hypothetical protein [Caudoviricetes sp.]
MKYSEAEKRIKALSSKYDVYMGDGDFAVDYKNIIVAWVKGDERYLFYNDETIFKKLPFSNKLYMILSELAITPLDERVVEKKYFIHVLKGYYGYLNFVNDEFELSDNNNTDVFKTKFTDENIEHLKQREDIPLDWNKVTLEEAE